MVTIDDKDITIIQGNDNTAMMIVLVACGLIVVLLLGLLLRFMHNKLRAD